MTERISLEIHKQLAAAIRAYEKACSEKGRINKYESQLFNKLQRIKSELDNLLMMSFPEYTVGELSNIYYGGRGDEK